MIKHRVGHGKPPKARRFKKGQSGNPKGRPKGSRNFATELTEELNQKVAVRENGVERKCTKQRAIIKSVINKSLQGDIKASSAVIAMSERHGKKGGQEAASTINPDELETLRRYFPRLQKLLEIP